MKHITHIALLFCTISVQAAERPNILLIIGDNWSAAHAGVMGDPTVRTPTFDNIAREGVLFENAFCPVPSCSPTRSSLLTGRVAHQLGPAANLWGTFPRDLVVFPDLLEQAGYQVGFCSKGWGPGQYTEVGWQRNPAGTDYNLPRGSGNGLSRDERQYAGFTRFLDGRDQEKPFFFWLGLINPSRPTWQDQQGRDRGLRPESVEVPPWLPDVPEVREHLLDYYASIERLDEMAGRALSDLAAAGVLENTIIVYTGDNGWQLPRGLAHIYDGGTKVPLAIKEPSGWKTLRNLRRKEFVTLTDLAPTFLQWAGVDVPSNMNGRSLVPLVRNEAIDTTRDAVFLERERHANVREGDLGYPVRAIRTPDFLYVHNLKPDRWPAGDPELWFAVGPFGDVDDSATKQFLLAHRTDPSYAQLFELSFGKRPAEELYDLRSDPDQIHNVAQDPAYESQLVSLRNRVHDWQADTFDPRLNPADNEFDEYPYLGPRFQAK